ncbi:MAG TPA: hypothetical protein VHU24_05960 [Solirubrobacterales bacterium]|nr:hypothetical protein [Solirubrobacterales bacterium]
MADYVRMPSIWLLIVAVVAAVNLRLIVPGVMAFLGIWKPPATVR